jgi:hypothetical protein
MYLDSKVNHLDSMGDGPEDRGISQCAKSHGILRDEMKELFRNHLENCSGR